MSVLIFGLNNRYCAVISDIHQPVDVIDAARPRTSQCVLQRFRLSDAFKRIVTEHVLDQHVDSFECFAVLGLPVDIVFPPTGGPGRKSVAHGSMSPCSAVWSLRAVSRAASRRIAFLGERSRWLVSTRESYSSFDMSTADPRLDMISTSAWSRFTRSIRPNKSHRASLAVIAMPSPSGTRYGTALVILPGIFKNETANSAKLETP